MSDATDDLREPGKDANGNAPRRGGEDAALDELLATARWPDLSAAADERLRLHLRVTLAPSEPTQLRRRRWAAVAAAAALLVLFATWRVTTTSVPHDAIEPTLAKAQPPQDLQKSAALAEPQPTSPPARDRLPTLYERALFASVVQSKQRSAATAAVGSRAAPAATVDPAPTIQTLRTTLHHASAGPHRPGGTAPAIDADVLSAFVAAAEPADWPLLRRCAGRADTARPVADALLASDKVQSVDWFLRLIVDRSTRAPALAALRAAKDPPVEPLLARLGSPLVEQRFAAAKALGSLCDDGTLARLDEMARRDDHRREALAALLSCDGPAARRFLDDLRRIPSIAAQVVAIRGELGQLFS